MIDKGVPAEDDITQPENTTVFSFPVESPDNAVTRNDQSAVEQLNLWQLEKPNRQLIVVSGIESTANDLGEISSINNKQVEFIQLLLNPTSAKYNCERQKYH